MPEGAGLRARVSWVSFLAPTSRSVRAMDWEGTYAFHRCGGVLEDGLDSLAPMIAASMAWGR